MDVCAPILLCDASQNKGSSFLALKSETNKYTETAKIMSNSDHKSLLAYHPEYLDYNFGPDHPLRPERLTAGLELLDQAGLIDRDRDTLVPDRADAEIALVHDDAYIHAVREAGDSWLPYGMLQRYGLSHPDNPAFPAMHEAAARVVGGSAAAMRQVMTGEIAHAFNPGGGWHHALRARAAGFCVYNDAAVAAAVAVHEFDARVLYLDFDCHHGDGVQWIFYDDPRVLTVSFHEDGQYLFPGTGGLEERGIGEGEGYAVNVPLAPFTDDSSWTEVIQTVVPAVADSFRPDVILSLHGADTHVWDPLTHLSLSTESFQRQAQLVHQLAHAATGGRWLAMGSGGYDWRRVVPRSWAILWTEMTGRPLPDKLPDDWIKHWSAGAPEPFPTAYLDSGALLLGQDESRAATRANRATLADALSGFNL